jgi:hypothetical protein
LVVSIAASESVSRPEFLAKIPTISARRIRNDDNAPYLKDADIVLFHMGLKGLERDWYVFARDGAEPNSNHVTMRVLSKKEETGWRV